MERLQTAAGSLGAAGSTGIDELHAHLVADLGPEACADWVVGLGLAEVPGADSAVLVVADRAHPPFELVAGTDPLALHVLDVELAAADGPGLEALRTGAISEMARTTDRHPRWNDVRAVCLRRGVMSFVAVPLSAGGDRRGFITLFSESADAFTVVRLARAIEFAAAAGVVLTNTLAYWGARSRADSLAVALESRATIDQAKGMIMHAVSCSADQAFRLLVEQSQFENRKVRDIARELVDRTADPGGPGRPAATQT